MTKTVIIGAGNVGFHLGKALNDLPDAKVLQVYSRRRGKAAKAARYIDCQYTTKLHLVNTEADLYILAVSDGALGEVTEYFGSRPDLAEKLFVHTSGATPETILRAHLARTGVFYPLQTFSVDRRPDFSAIPFCLQARDAGDLVLLRKLAGRLSNRVEQVTDAQRAVLHVAAVFVNNFTNYLYTVGERITETEKVDFDLLQPLIAETARKIKNHSPRTMQTGPAVRNDTPTIERHLKYLEKFPEFRAIYTLLTEQLRRSVGG